MLDTAKLLLKSAYEVSAWQITPTSQQAPLFLAAVLVYEFRATQEIETFRDAARLVTSAVKKGFSVNDPPDHDTSTFIFALLLNSMPADWDVSGILGPLLDDLMAYLSTDPGTSPIKGDMLHLIGDQLLEQHHRRGGRFLLEAANRIATKLTTLPGESHARHLDLLGVTQRSLYRETGKREHLHNALGAHRRAVMSGAPNPVVRAMFEDHLAIVLRESFKAGGVSAELDEAIELSRKTVEALKTVPESRGVAYLNLGNHLLARCEADGRKEDLDDSIETYRAGIAASSADAYTLDLQGALLSALSRRSDDAGSFCEAVELFDGIGDKLCANPALGLGAALNLQTSAFLAKKWTIVEQAHQRLLQYLDIAVFARERDIEGRRYWLDLSQWRFGHVFQRADFAGGTRGTTLPRDTVERTPGEGAGRSAGGGSGPGTRRGRRGGRPD